MTVQPPPASVLRNTPESRTAGNENIGILRVEGDQRRLGIATKSRKGSGTAPVLVSKDPSGRHGVIQAGVVGPSCAAIYREHHPRSGRPQI